MPKKEKSLRSPDLREFILIIRDIVRSEEFKEMKGYKHHIKSSLYEHSVKVAYLCFKHRERFKMKIGCRELVRGAILHDFYLYDLHGGSETHRLHWFIHPRIAFKNAIDRYPELTEKQIDMIKHHMFPITVIPPRSAAGWLVCFYDKVAALSDRFGKNT